MKTSEFLKNIENYSLQIISQKADERIEGVLQKRIAALESIKEVSQHNYLKSIFSMIAGIAVLILALNLSISKEQMFKSGINTGVNSNSLNFVMTTNDNAGFNQVGRNKQKVPVFLGEPTYCERVSRNYWSMAYN